MCLELRIYLLAANLNRSKNVGKDPRFHQCVTIIDVFSNMVIEITETCSSEWVQLRSVNLSFTCDFSIEWHFYTVFCFSACSNQILVIYQYGFRAHASVNFNFCGFWSCKTIIFVANRGTTFSANIFVSSILQQLFTRFQIWFPDSPRFIP